ncbi:hypothetical protein [Lactobacillus delbrueckii]|uniref:hypothetical protein n=1 Tax=Lactobacillus delbrueckii TaxID=1584 RepID=UPI0035CFA83A
MRRKAKGLISLAVAMSVFAVFANLNEQKADAAFVSRQATCTWKSRANITTGWFTLHGKGYSYPNSGKVTSAWITSGSAMFNTIVNKKHWTYKTPRGMHLMGQATDKCAVGTQWAYVPISSDTRTVGVQF